MLKHLIIKNYALIEALEMNPSSKLNIITGETGAGKSIMVGATGLLLGQRADIKTLLDPEVKCIVEGTFDLSDYQLAELFEQLDIDHVPETILRREIRPNGKSRAFINDTPVTLDTMKQVGCRLINIHSQHETLLLGTHIFQLEVIDAYAGSQTMQQDYQSVFRHYIQLEKQLKTSQQEMAAIRKEADYRDFLLQEFIQADLQPGEQEQLEAKLAIQEHAEEIKSKLLSAAEALNSHEMAITTQLQLVLKHLQQLSSISEPYQNLHARLEAAYLEIKDIAAELEAKEQDVTHEPEQIQQLQDRLSLIYQLQQKHQVQSVEELLQIQGALESRALKNSTLEEEIEGLQAQAALVKDELMQKAERLSQARQKAGPAITRDLLTHLKNLAMQEAKLQVNYSKTEPTETGIDQIEILFSANKGIEPKPLKQVASGGEFSRLMFCLKYIMADKTALPTVVFDEIDTGISGETALKMVEMMKIMAQSHQVITISHLPQFAAQGDTHYYVYKDQTQSKAASRMKQLEGEERVLAVAQMLGGDQPSAIALENAKEMLDRTF